MATTVFIAEIWSLSLPDAHPLRNDTTSQKTQDHLESKTAYFIAQNAYCSRDIYLQ